MKDSLMAIGNLRDDGPAGYAARRHTSRRSWRRLSLRLGLMVLILAGLASGVYWCLTASMFAVSRVESGAYRYTGEAQLQEAMSGFLGRNIWTLSTDEVAEQLAGLPWVRDLNVARRLPSALEIDFREWRPLLVVAATQRAEPPQVLIADGRVLAFPDHLEPAGLAVLVDVPTLRDDATGDVKLGVEQASQVLALVEAIEHSGLEAVSPVDFIVNRQDGYAVVLQDGAGTLQLGQDAFAERLDRYMIARDHLERGLTVDLRFDDRLTWQESGTTEK